MSFHHLAGGSVRKFKRRPSVFATNSNSGSLGGSGSITCTLPGSIRAGDLILVVAVAQSSSGARTASTPSGYTESLNEVQSGEIRRACLWYRWATGSDTDPTSTISGSANWGMQVIVVRNAKASHVPIISSRDTGTASSFDVSNTAITWAPQSTLYILALLTQTATSPSTPANFTSVLTGSSRVNTWSLLYKIGASVDPASTAIGSSINYAAFLVCVRGGSH